MSSNNIENFAANGFRPVDRTIPVHGRGGYVWQAEIVDLSGMATRDVVGKSIHSHPRRTGHKNPHRVRPTS